MGTALLAVVIGGLLCRFVFACGLRDTSRPVPKPRPAKGFVDEVVVKGLTRPTSFAFLPDGRMLFAEKVGIVRVAGGGRLLHKPLLDIRAEVDSGALRGLLGLAVDPSFERNGYIYLDYVRKAPGNAGPWSVRVSRFTVRDDVALPSSEQVILGAAASPACEGQPRRADCIPVDGYHAGGDLEFGPDRALFVTTGDGGFGNEPELRAFRSQAVDSLSGKVLRVTRNGRGLPSNPFWNGDPTANRSKVWALGLRNPFRITVGAAGDVVFAADVGWNSWEELDVVRAGRNYGWPCFEGLGPRLPYSRTSRCRALRARHGATPPVLARSHSVATDVVVGPIYAGAAYPARYRGSLVYGDFDRSYLRSVQVSGLEHPVASGDTLLLSGAPLPAQIRIGPGGDVYYLSYAGGLHRLRYYAKGP